MNLVAAYEIRAKFNILKELLLPFFFLSDSVLMRRLLTSCPAAGRCSGVPMAPARSHALDRTADGLDQRETVGEEKQMLI